MHLNSFHKGVVKRNASDIENNMSWKSRLNFEEKFFLFKEFCSYRWCLKMEPRVEKLRKLTFERNYFFDCELRSIAVLRMTLLLLLGISTSQILINNRPFGGWINNLIFLWNSDYEISIFNQQYCRAGLLIGSRAVLLISETFLKEEGALNSIA